MKLAKIKTKVMFNGTERELCGICRFPSGFCKHTMEADFKESCPDTPLTKEDTWQLVRSHAIAKTYNKNLMYYVEKDMNEIKSEKNKLEERCRILEAFVLKLKEGMELT